MNTLQVNMINFMNNINLNYNLIDEDDQIRIEVFNHKGEYEFNFVMENEDECGVVYGPYNNEKNSGQMILHGMYEYLAAFNRKFTRNND